MCPVLIDLPDPHAPLLIFDSGVGGLSVLAQIRQRIPLAPVVFAMDRAGFPYGERHEDDLTIRITALLGRLVERYRPRLVVIACNTASTIALASVRDVLDVPVVGTVPAIKPAVALTHSGVIGVLGTAATVRQRYVEDLTQRFAADCHVLRAGAPELVSHVEARLRGAPPNPAVVRASLALLTQQPHGQSMDTVVLACTHFPLVQDELAAASTAGMQFVDGALGIARRVEALVAGQVWPSHPVHGITVTTGTTRAHTAFAHSLDRFGLNPPCGL